MQKKLTEIAKFEPVHKDKNRRLLLESEYFLNCRST